MFKLFASFMVAVLIVLLVAQAVGSDTNAEVSANEGDSGSSMEMAEQGDSATEVQSSSPYHKERLSISGGGSMNLPK
jgi:hypothetical protein